MYKRLIIAIVLLGIVGGGIVWFKYFRDDMIAQFLGGMVPPPTPVTTETLESVTWQPGIEAVGTALSARGVDLAIESSGMVEDVLFAGNDEIKEGQRLVQINSASELAALEAAKAALNVAVADANRAKTLAGRGVGAANTVESAEAQVESVRAQLAQLQTQLDQKLLTAPFDGVIGIPRVEVGQYVSAGMIFATLQDLSNMRVDFSVPEQQIGDLTLGGTITVATEVGGFSATGTIIAVEPRVDANSRMVLVRAEVQNPSGQLYPGQFLRVRIDLPQEDGVIAVPQTAVSSTLYGDTIYVLRAGEAAEEYTAEQVFVTIGRRSGGRIEVVDGLQAGDQIVTSGQNRLTPGARVKIDNSVKIDAVSTNEPATEAPETEAPAEAAPAAQE
ncbi:efflux RND transporter periplasmic adaptor subunit [Xinfangfangia sp. CPCC 101601]|uniref:Efflux RND transporter periplasmic adaptor subunit n=1 Tax=Pseudogemmobacter lacusdianii TaxID=3069608 RepID=A0ABU0VZ82_9RHOB|nr:efflux RND transporter periplasmic adaptor subunit [Xinfangfangia sp. CPCC 101601]MDQ2067056.1 efflux RND transporter periplasmic adaptor subunit [Xinfangfangia sp. CPCC 101601]